MAAVEMFGLAIPWLAALSGPPKLGIPSVLTTDPLFVIVIAVGLCVTVIPVPPKSAFMSMASPAALACGMLLAASVSGTSLNDLNDIDPPCPNTA